MIATFLAITTGPTAEGERLIKMLGEALVPGLPDFMYLPTTEARAELLRRFGPGFLSFISDERNFEMTSKLLGGSYTHEESVVTCSQGSGRTITSEGEIDFHIAMEILKVLSNHLPRSRVNALKVYPYVLLIASAKRGNVSAGALRKVIEATQTAVPTAEGLLTLDNFRKVFKTYGGYMDDVIAKTVLAAWEEDIPPEFLRMRIICRQTAGESLTQWITIMEALDKYMTFPWEYVKPLWPQEWHMLHEATIAIGGNEFYGIHQDLGPAKSANFRKIGYVAKELMVKVGGEAALTQYSGWVMDFPGRVKVDDMIMKYEKTYLSKFVMDQSARTADEQAALAELLIPAKRREPSDQTLYAVPDCTAGDE